MPWPRPTYTALKQDVAQDIAGQLQGTDPTLRFAVLTIIGKVVARLANLHYSFQDWIAKMSVPFTAENEYLLGWAALKNVTLKQATYAGATGGAVTFSNCTPTIPIPAGTPLVRGDGFVFLTLGTVVVNGSGIAIVTPIAQSTGAAGNTPLNGILQLGTTIAGIQTNGSVSTAITGGNDAETLDQLRSRMLQVYQNTPQGGAQADYVKWTLEVPGVTRAWVVPVGMGPGSVLVYFMEDVTESAFNGFPQGTNGGATAETRIGAATGDQLAVANYLYGSNTVSRQPVGALVYVVAPTANTINFTIDHILSASAAVKAQIALAIAGVFLEFGVPGGTVDLSDIEAAIAAVPGSEGFVIASPTDNIVSGAGALPVLGTVTYA